MLNIRTFLTATASAALTACAVYYTPPSESPSNAKLIFPSRSADWGVLKGVSTSTPIFGLSETDQCGTYVRPPKGITKNDDNLEVKIPGGIDIFVGFVATDPGWECQIHKWFHVEKTASYKFIKVGGGARCGLGVAKIVGETLIPVNLNSAEYINQFTGKVCKK